MRAQRCHCRHVSQKRIFFVCLSNPCCHIQSRKMWHFLVSPLFWLCSRGSLRDSKVNKRQINRVLWSRDAIDTARWRPAEDVPRKKRGEEEEGDWSVRRLNGLHCAPAALQSWAPKWGGHRIFAWKFSFLVFVEGFFLCVYVCFFMQLESCWWQK